MKVVKNKWCINLLLIIFCLLCIFLISYKNSDNKTILEDKEEISVDKKQFGMYVENEDGEFVEYTDSELFPDRSIYIFNTIESHCVDNKDNVLENAISYDNGKVTITSNKTTYCYLYFNYNEPPTITSITKTSDEQTSITVSVVASSDTTTYYYKIDSSDYVSSTSSTHTFTGLTKGTEYSISVYVVDDKGAKSITITNKYSTKSNPTISEQILANPTTGLNTTLEGDLYRYQGTSVNNYICFGTSDKDTCLSNTDAHMYRIIGIASDGMIKVMKNEALENTIAWYSNLTIDVLWYSETGTSSLLYTAINGSSFLVNSTYMPSGWEDKVQTVNWKYGDITDYNITAVELYNIENSWETTVNAKIGLMYLHDYYYAYQSGGLNCSYAGGKYGYCKLAWMHFSVCDSGAPYTLEMTMSRYGWNSSASRYSAWQIDSSGMVAYQGLNHYGIVRPVFYLTNSVNYLSGSGTSNDPFIIS